jgi:hypothetical protein
MKTMLLEEAMIGWLYPIDPMADFTVDMLRLTLKK